MCFEGRVSDSVGTYKSFWGSGNILDINSYRNPSNYREEVC